MKYIIYVDVDEKILRAQTENEDHDVSDLIMSEASWMSDSGIYATSVEREALDDGNNRRTPSPKSLS